MKHNNSYLTPEFYDDVDKHWAELSNALCIHEYVKNQSIPKHITDKYSEESLLDIASNIWTYIKKFFIWLGQQIFKLFKFIILSVNQLFLIYLIFYLMKII